MRTHPAGDRNSQESCGEALRLNAWHCAGPSARWADRSHVQKRIVILAHADCRTVRDPTPCPARTFRAHALCCAMVERGLPSIEAVICVSAEIQLKAMPLIAVESSRSGRKRRDRLLEFRRKQFPGAVGLDAQNVAARPARFLVLEHVGGIDATHYDAPGLWKGNAHPRRRCSRSRHRCPPV